MTYEEKEQLVEDINPIIEQLGLDYDTYESTITQIINLIYNL